MFAEACLRIDEEIEDYRKFAVAFINACLAEMLDYENKLRYTKGADHIMAARITDLTELFPYDERLLMACSFLLTAYILEDDDLNKMNMYRARAISSCEQISGGGYGFRLGIAGGEFIGS